MADTNVNETENSQNSEYKAHAQKYTDFLENYRRYTKESNELKNKYKKKFFWIIMIILASLVVTFITVVIVSVFIIPNKKSIEVIVVIITTVISSFSTVLVALFQLPKIIADYLFNKKENSSIAKIIEQIQQNDKDMYTLEKRVERKLMEQGTLQSDMDLSETSSIPPLNPDEVLEERKLMEQGTL